MRSDYPNRFRSTGTSRFECVQPSPSDGAQQAAGRASQKRPPLDGNQISRIGGVKLHGSHLGRARWARPGIKRQSETAGAGKKSSRVLESPTGRLQPGRCPGRALLDQNHAVGIAREAAKPRRKAKQSGRGNQLRQGFVAPKGPPVGGFPNSCSLRGFATSREYSGSRSQKIPQPAGGSPAPGDWPFRRRGAPSDLSPWRQPWVIECIAQKPRRGDREYRRTMADYRLLCRP